MPKQPESEPPAVLPPTLNHAIPDPPELASFAKQISSRRIAVLGLGISNTPLVRFLFTLGVDRVDCFDRSDAGQLKPVMEQ